MSYGNGESPAASLFESDALDRIDDPSDYAALRRVRNVEDARENFLDRRERAYELFWDKQITRNDYLKALRMAVERYLSESRQTIQRHKYGQWFWAGEPPTMTGQSPFKKEGGNIAFDEDGEAVVRAIRPDKTIEHPETGEDIEVGRLIERSGRRLNRPVFLTDDDGRLPFGRQPNILGKFKVPQVDRTIRFIGLESLLDFPDPLTVEWEELTSHPTAIRQMETRTEEYQLPEQVSTAAFEQINEFWEQHAGLGLSGSGLPKQTGMNLVEGRRGRVEKGDI